MCYSAMAWQEYQDYSRRLGAEIGIKEFIRLFWDWEKNGTPYRVPKAMEAAFMHPKTDAEREIKGYIEAIQAKRRSALETELFSQKTRLNKAVASLKLKETKKALDDQRIAANKIKAASRNLEDLKRKTLEPKDSRFFPGWYSTVMTSENGKRVVTPMRYGCRPAGKPAFFDKKYPGTYNARRNSLEGFWKDLFGYTHALMVVTTFFENVEAEDGTNKVLEFTPRDGEPMYVACLWSRWTDPKGIEPDLLSFAAITDEPEPEVAAVGHDRTIINIKPEHIDAWLNPDPNNLQALYDIFDDKQHPYYLHRLAA